MSARRFTFLRHAQSTYNVRQILSGDPTVAVSLSPEGHRQAAAARRLVARMEFDLAVHTRFPRTTETLGIILRDRLVPTEEYAEFDDVDVGEFEGHPLADYRAWRADHAPDDAPPGGESRIAALRRYVAGYDRLLATDACEVLAVLHDVPIRFLMNAAHDADPIAGPHQSVPNAVPTTYAEGPLRRAVDRMRARLDR
jgi:broad specificity phosphatase PhoE